MRSELPRLLLVALLAGLPAPAALAEDVTLASMPVGECTLRVEARMQEPQGLRVRAVHPAHRNCAIDEDSLTAVLRAALPGPRVDGTAPAYSSLFLGRLVDYPWLSAQVARAAAVDPAWNARRGRPARGDVNAYVAGVLARPAATAALRPALEDAGYRIAGVSVEKVLVLPAREIQALGGEALSGLLPFDAMTWLGLAPR